MTYKGIIFDFNGTLIWDTPLHKEAWLRFSRELDVELTEKRYYNDVHGRSTKNILELLLERKLGSDEYEYLSNRKESLYMQACLDNPDIYCFAPGVNDFLDYLVKKNIPRTIATASDRQNLDFFIETLELNRWFDTELFAYDDGHIKNKPEPDLYHKAAEKLGTEVESLVVVEDTFFGVLAAKNAGAGYLIVTGPAEDQHDELDGLEGIDQFISDFTEIDRNLFSV